MRSFFFCFSLLLIIIIIVIVMVLCFRGLFAVAFCCRQTAPDCLQQTLIILNHLMTKHSSVGTVRPLFSPIRSTMKVQKTVCAIWQFKNATREHTGKEEESERVRARMRRQRK